ncbi:hypothetical protein ACVMBZ_003964 [Bradyrhizobium liaoningense]
MVTTHTVITGAAQPKGDEDGDQQDRQHFAIGKRAKERMRDDVQHEIRKSARTSLLGEFRGHRRIERIDGHMHAHARLDQRHRDQPGQQGEHGQQVEQRHGFHQCAADLAGITDAVDAADDGAEYDRRDHHLDELDEAVSQGLQRGTKFRLEMAGQDTQHEANQHLDVKDPIEWLSRLDAHRPGQRLRVHSRFSHGFDFS